MEIKMYDIFSVDFPETNGSVQSGKRPAVIMQNDKGCLYAPTVIVIPLSTSMKKLSQPTHCIIKKSNINNLKQNSVLLAEQVMVIDKNCLDSKIGRIDEEMRFDVLDCYLANVTGKRNNIRKAA